MSSSCCHSAPSEWTGPTPDEIIRANGQRHIVVEMAHPRLRRPLLVHVVDAHRSMIGDAAVFTAVDRDGVNLGRVTVCQDRSHRNLMAVEFATAPAALRERFPMPRRHLRAVS